MEQMPLSSQFAMPRKLVHFRLASVVAMLGLLCATPCLAAPRGADGQLEIEIVDAETGLPLAARIYLTNSRGRPVKLSLPNSAQFADHFYVDGHIVLPFRTGQYKFELETGPEYRTRSGHFEIERHADDTERIEMSRFVDLAEEGWWAGDLDVSRDVDKLELAKRAESISYVPTSAWQDAGGIWSEATESFGKKGPIGSENDASLLAFDLQQPIEARGPLAPLAAIRAAREAGGHIVARTPFAWDLPVWLASGELDAIEVIHHHALRNGVVDNEAGGRPRDHDFYPGHKGNGRWSEAIYYHVLNCGLRIPPAAGSGSGTNENPLGVNRVYVYCGPDYSPARWWEGLEAGRVFVTNGPLLRPLVEGQPPGRVFQLDQGGKLALEIGLNLATRVPVEYLEIIKDGHTEQEVRLADWKESQGRLPPLDFDASGWFLVRAVTNDTKTYRFAATGPYYVEQAGQPRISRASVEFFLDWIDERIAHIAQLNDLDDSERAALLADQQFAREFFADLLAKANAD
jgi:hypothetical protein